MRFLNSRDTRSIIFASGTLAPLPSFISAMGIPFGAILESKHCANKNQLVVGALRKGSNGTDLLGTFQNRNNPNYKQTIGELILQLASVTPQGMLLSEGIDFADSHCRSLIIVGIPFPPLFDPRVILKKSYLLEAVNTKNKNSNNYLLSADEWYKVEGTRTVNQAFGRIIRHKEDFGAVILADCRYATMDRNMFPSWMRDSIKIHSEPNTILPCIERFFNERGFLGRSSKNVEKNNFETSKICKEQNYSSPKDNISSRKRNERHFMLNENILEIYDQFQVEEENDENSGGFGGALVIRGLRPNSILLMQR
uniref:ATP-dependent helicase C-terminal domain-containing protein n=1 Tax=Meloidogyne javanica TaxID=6303 RepID=A0A915LJT0_MELJA